MTAVKVSQLPETIGHSKTGSEFGQVIQNGINRRARVLFTDSTSREFIIPSSYSIKAFPDSTSDAINIVDANGYDLHFGPKGELDISPDTNLIMYGVKVKGITVPNAHSYDGWSSDQHRVPLIGIGSDDVVTVGNTLASTTILQGSNQVVSVRKESSPGSGNWSDCRIMDESNVKDYIVLHRNSVYTYGTEDPNDNDGYPDGHLYLKVTL